MKLFTVIVLIFSVSLLRSQDIYAEVSVHPDSPVAWERLDQVLESQGKTLKVFNFHKQTFVFKEPNGDVNITIPPSILVPNTTAHPESKVESSAWMSYVQSKMPQAVEGKSDYSVPL